MRPFFATMEKSTIHAMFFSEKSRRHIILFLLRIVLNIQKYYKDFCECAGPHTNCYVRTYARNEKNSAHELYENCLNLDFLTKCQPTLHGQVCFLYDHSPHFAVTIFKREFFYKRKCFLTGNIIKISLEAACSKWENGKIKQITRSHCRVVIDSLDKNVHRSNSHI